MLVLIRPTIPEALDTAEQAIANRMLLLLVGDCFVKYKGRSSSSLSWGERVVIWKPDGAVLVHRPKGSEAVNWQPSGSRVSAQEREQLLLLTVSSPKPRELLSLSFRKVLLAAGLPLRDTAQFELPLTEEELYEVLRRRPDLIERGFRITSSQRDLGEGTPDFTGIDSTKNYVAVEVKKDRVGTEAVKQAYRYVADLRRSAPKVRGIIVAPTASRAATRLARNLGIEMRFVDLAKIARGSRAGPDTQSTTLDSHLAQ